MSSSHELWERWKNVVYFSKVSMARSAGRHTVFVNDRESIKGSIPVVDWHGPFLCYIPQR